MTLSSVEERKGDKTPGKMGHCSGRASSKRKARQKLVGTCPRRITPFSMPTSFCAKDAPSSSERVKVPTRTVGAFSFSHGKTGDFSKKKGLRSMQLQWIGPGCAPCAQCKACAIFCGKTCRGIASLGQGKIHLIADKICKHLDLIARLISSYLS